MEAVEEMPVSQSGEVSKEGIRGEPGKVYCGSGGQDCDRGSRASGDNGGNHRPRCIWCGRLFSPPPQIQKGRFLGEAFEVKEPEGIWITRADSEGAGPEEIRSDHDAWQDCPDAVPDALMGHDTLSPSEELNRVSEVATPIEEVNTGRHTGSTVLVKADGEEHKVVITTVDHVSPGTDRFEVSRSRKVRHLSTVSEHRDQQHQHK